MTRFHTAVVVLASCIVGAQALAAPADEHRATAGAERAPATVRLTAVVDSIHQVDNPPEGDSQGDMLVFTQKLKNASGRNIGTADAYCVRTAPERVRECQGTFSLPKGEVFVSGPDPDGVRRHALAIVGGTRTYSDVRGHVTLTHTSALEDSDTFRFKR